MKTIFAITIFAVLPHLSITVTAGAEGTPLGKGAYEISCVGDGVTVRANDANVVELLKEFSLKSGITFNKYIGKTQTITLDLSGVTAEEFLNRVIGSYVATSKKKNGSVHLSTVTIMDEGGEDAAVPHEPPPPREPEVPPEGPRMVPHGPTREERGPPWRKDPSARSSRRRMPRESPPPDSPPRSAEESKEMPPPPEQQPAP